MTHDGCKGCRYESCDEYMMPCVKCKQNYMDRYKPMPKTDMISRAELFNKLATVNAPPEANAYKTEVYRIINEMGEDEG